MADPDPPKTGARIRRRREEAGLSLSRLAQEAGVSKGYVWNLEKGKTDGRPSGRILYQIARELGTTMADLLGREGLPGSPTAGRGWRGVVMIPAAVRLVQELRRQLHHPSRLEEVVVDQPVTPAA